MLDVIGSNWILLELIGYFSNKSTKVTSCATIHKKCDMSYVWNAITKFLEVDYY